MSSPFHKITTPVKNSSDVNILSSPITTIPSHFPGPVLEDQLESLERNMQESIEIFNKYIAEGPIYVCSICQQNQFKDKVTLINKMYSLKKNKT